MIVVSTTGEIAANHKIHEKPVVKGMDAYESLCITNTSSWANMPMIMASTIKKFSNDLLLLFTTVITGKKKAGIAGFIVQIFMQDK
jgi:hypothetical protein